MIAWLREVEALLPAWKLGIAISVGALLLMGIVAAPFNGDVGWSAAPCYLGLLLVPVLYIAGAKRRAEGRRVLSIEKTNPIPAGIAFVIFLNLVTGVLDVATSNDVPDAFMPNVVGISLPTQPIHLKASM